MYNQNEKIMILSSETHTFGRETLNLFGVSDLKPCFIDYRMKKVYVR